MDFFRRLVGLPPAASTAAGGIDALHLFILATTLLGGAYVLGTALLFVVRYRQRQTRALTERVVASRAREVTIIVGILGLFVLWWVIGFRQYTELHAAPSNADLVLVEAKQWTWKFAYADGRVSNNQLVVEVGRPVKLVLSSRDVIHSFFVPAFRVKQDAVPGRTTSIWFEPTMPGTFPIWCAEYCGVEHSAMRGEVVVLGADDYARWRSGAGGSWAARGRDVAMRRGCVACHTLDGQRGVGPSWRGLFRTERVLTDGRRVIADEEYLTKSMMEPNVDLVVGYAPVMPTYRGVLGADEAGAIVELIKSIDSGSGADGGLP